MSSMNNNNSQVSSVDFDSMTLDVFTLFLAKELISRPSITPQDAGAQEYLTAILKQSGFIAEDLSYGEVTNTWLRFGQKSPLFVFAGHTDVVPPGEMTSWNSHPFQAEIREGFLFGRGSCDMKGQIAAFVAACREFLKLTGGNFPGSIALLLTSDEEGPGIHGTKHVVEVLKQRGIIAEYCLVGEPSSLLQLGDQVKVGRRGSLTGQLRIRGKQGHVAYPENVINPIHLATRVFGELVNQTWDTEDEFFRPSSLQIVDCHSGSGAGNVVPENLEATFNFRYSPQSSSLSLRTRATEIISKNCRSFELVWTEGATPYRSKQGKLVQAVTESIESLLGLHPQLSTGGGTSDGRFLAPLGCEVVELGLPSTSIHEVNERVSVEELTKLGHLYLCVLKRLFQD